MEFKEWLIAQEGSIFANRGVETTPNTRVIATTNTDFEKPNVLYITGMNSSGSVARNLAMQGYPVKTISTENNWKATIIGRTKQWPGFKQVIGGMADREGDAHISNQIQKVHSEIPLNWHPEIVVGGSQGGAVAMACVPLFPNAKFILISPAWKIFNVKPHLPPGSVIIHGTKDMQVPITDSEELAQATGAKLVTTNNGHRIDTGFVLSVIGQLAKAIKPPKEPEANDSPKLFNYNRLQPPISGS